jgi:hypothetical protein
LTLPATPGLNLFMFASPLELPIVLRVERNPRVDRTTEKLTEVRKPATVLLLIVLKYECDFVTGFL